MIRIPNVGATCYLNSLIQCLYCFDMFRHFIHKSANKSKLVECVDFFMRPTDKSIVLSPKDVHSKIVIMQSELDIPMFLQNDTHEIYTMLIYKLHDVLGKQYEWQPPVPTIDKNEFFAMNSDLAFYKDMEKKRSFVSKHMYGRLIKQIRCGNCGFYHHNYESFLSFDVDITHQDVFECIKNTLKPKNVSSDWICDKCKTSSTTSERSTLLWKCPRIFVITIQRFSDYRSKNNKEVHIPTLLCIETQETICRYRLRSLASHYGSANNGHYVALAEHASKWWVIDDDRILDAKLDVHDGTISSSSAYMLFYEKVNTR